MSTLTEKLVDFDIMVESEPRRDPPAQAGKVADHTSALEESIFRLNGMLMGIKRNQKLSVHADLLMMTPIDIVSSFHTRENRGFSVVKSITSYV